MKTSDLLNHFKTQQAVADALGIAQASIAKWIRRGYVPHLRQLQLENFTRGALKAEAGILPRRKKQ
jgi:predicted site-specific integrase-resolvase